MGWPGKLLFRRKDGFHRPGRPDSRAPHILKGVDHAFSPELSGHLHLMTMHANLGRFLSGLGWRVLFKECSEGNKGESRPLKDRLCSGTTPIPGAFKSDATNDGP